MQLQEVQKEAEHSGMGHLLLSYPMTGFALNVYLYS